MVTEKFTRPVVTVEVLEHSFSKLKCTFDMAATNNWRSAAETLLATFDIPADLVTPTTDTALEEATAHAWCGDKLLCVTFADEE